MRKGATFVLSAAALLVIALSSVGSRTTKTEAGSSPVPSPTPTAVSGTVLRGREATVKPGYKFVNRNGSVDVIDERKNYIVGTYVCPCGSSTPAGKCDLVFSPTYLVCKNGSCSSGSCLLTAAPRLMHQ